MVASHADPEALYRGGGGKSQLQGPGDGGLAARPPFFHDGSSATLRDVVLFYDNTFRAGLQSFEVDALVAFLSAL